MRCNTLLILTLLFAVSCSGGSDTGIVQVATTPTTTTVVPLTPMPTQLAPTPIPTNPPALAVMESPTPALRAPAVSTPTLIPIVSPTAVPSISRVAPTPKPRRRTYDLELLGIPKFLNFDWIELDKIGGISMFRSGIGHDFSHLDVYEEWSCRSMKHYFFMRSKDNLTNVFSPVSAEVIELGKGNEANTRIAGQSVGRSDVQVRMRVTDSEYQAFVVILFHVDLGVLLRVGDTVSAGQVLGKKSDQVTGLDIAIYADTPQGKRLISYFDVIDDNVFQKYADRGIISREIMIISKKRRNANLLSCTGVYFDRPGSLPGIVSIDEPGEASLLGGTGYSPQGYQGEESPPPASGGTGPNIEQMTCTEEVQVNKKVHCSFKYSGFVDRVAWLALGGDPEKGKEYRFTTQYENPGAYVITLEACNKRDCTVKTKNVDVVAASTG